MRWLLDNNAYERQRLGGFGLRTDVRLVGRDLELEPPPKDSAKLEDDVEPTRLEA